MKIQKVTNMGGYIYGKYIYLPLKILLSYHVIHL